ncbi:unnamed protein product [Nippostrongylus brasiliensis]|uniref:Uncharacterized protein n=1 Tax=Nippostrongylus brasiliensis TaxID=27835 RepID=A0A0N4YH44_NIPBR|nr:unnamed protein product [Nippostrongylus brasiliensis]
MKMFASAVREMEEGGEEGEKEQREGEEEDQGNPERLHDKLRKREIESKRKDSSTTTTRDQRVHVAPQMKLPQLHLRSQRQRRRGGEGRPWPMLRREEKKPRRCK